MKVIIIGGTGTIGSAVAKELSSRNEVLIVGQTTGEMSCDMTSESSIRQLFEKAGKFHAVVVTAGSAHFEDFSSMTVDKYQVGINSKLMGQVNIVRIGCQYIQEEGSFTLTSGCLSHDPIRSGSSASMVNSAIDGFVRAASIELPKGLRINSVSPTILVESIKDYGPFFIGFEPVAASRVALAYSKSVEGLQTGQTYRVG